MDTKTIDERIREKAQQELKNKISIALAPAIALSVNQGRIETALYFNQNKVSVRDALQHVSDSLFSFYAKHHEEEAIKAFLKKVEDIEAQV